MADSLAYSEAIQAKAMIDNAQKHGVRMIYWSEKMLDAFKKTWEEVAEEQAARIEIESVKLGFLTYGVV